jgi:hypothetical protein
MNKELFLEGDPFDDPVWQQAELMVDAPPRPAKGYVTCSLGWLAWAWPQVRSGRQLAVLLLIYRRCLWARSRTVSVPNGDLADIGLSRYGKYRALAALDELGLIITEPWDGKTIQVTLLNFP